MDATPTPEKQAEVFKTYAKAGAERMLYVLTTMIELGAFQKYLNESERTAAIWKYYENPELIKE